MSKRKRQRPILYSAPAPSLPPDRDWALRALARLLQQIAAELLRLADLPRK